MEAKWKAMADKSIQSLRENRYPGRGIVIGLSPDSTSYIQVYWIMGRSENSRNRTFIEEDNGFVRTEAKDPAKLTDPSLIIYYPVKTIDAAHIVTNGDQTDTIYDAIKDESSFEAALAARTFEPDGPNFTPRISGLVDLNDTLHAYKLAILKTNAGYASQTLRHYFHYEDAVAGYGHLIHTYDSDGDPLPSFTGEPKLVPLLQDVEATAQLYWDLLDEDNRISLLVKSIHRETRAVQTFLINKS